MSLVSLIVLLAVIGVIMWVVNTQLPIQDPYKKILNIVVAIVIVVWLLSLAGILPDLNAIRVGK